QPDGNIEFLGRIDHQVKIRGYRVELGEIEAGILTHPEIKDVVVSGRQTKDGDNILCAYYVQAGKKETEPELRRHLAREMPAYMIPGYFIKLEKIPLTINGKADRKALVRVQITKHQTPAKQPPRNNIERKLVRIWAQILGTQKETIGIEDDFFQIGGHSLRAMIMAARIHKEINVKLPLAKIFKNTTIKALSGILKTNVKEKYETIKPVEKKEYYELSSAQKRLSVLQYMDPESTAYNMPSTMPLGSPVNLERLQGAFAKLIHRHESLRTTFHMVEGTPVQKIHTTIPFKIETKPAHAAHPAFIRPFDISEAPLLRVEVKEITGTGTTDDERILQVDMHHIITDGTSFEILTKELLALYDGENLPPFKLQYKDYAQW
ncbi:MAG: hypothetical protein GY757_07845, partial [bacterium]|nr:hypothetical protein [bacterium]